MAARLLGVEHRRARRHRLDPQRVSFNGSGWTLMMLWLTDLIIGGFEIDGFWNYIWATIIVWAVNVVLDVLFRSDDRRAGSLATT